MPFVRSGINISYNMSSIQILVSSERLHLFEAVHIGFWFSHSLRVTCVNFFSFLKDVHLTKRYKNVPTVIVAAHHLSSDGNLKPIHNGITTWVEVNR